MSHAAVRGRLLKHYGHLISEFEQMIRDLEWWNNNRLDCAPFDIESTRIALSKAKQLYEIVQADDGRKIPQQLVDEMCAALEENI